MIAILDRGENDDCILWFNTYNNLSYYETLQKPARSCERSGMELFWQRSVSSLTEF